jgi:hypothetical protein
VEVQETRSCGQCDPGGKEGRRPTPQGIPDNGKHGHGPQNRHGGASRGERFLLRWKRGRLEQDAARRSWRADPGASQALVRPSALPTPSRGGNEMMFGEVPKKKGGEEDEVAESRERRAKMKKTDGEHPMGRLPRAPLPLRKREILSRPHVEEHRSADITPRHPREWSALRCVSKHEAGPGRASGRPRPSRRAHASVPIGRHRLMGVRPLRTRTEPAPGCLIW